MVDNINIISLHYMDCDTVLIPGVLIPGVFVATLGYMYISSFRGDIWGMKLFLYIWGIRCGYSVSIYDSDTMDSKTLRSVLSNEEKGLFFEHGISARAWLPLFSLESDDGPRWVRMKRVLMRVLRGLDHKTIPDLVGKYTTNINSCEDVSQIVTQVMFEFVFDRPIPHEHIPLFHSASMEWRKEIGMKGFGDVNIKKEFVEIIERYIPTHYFEMTDDRMEVVSAFAQPFFLSPMINVSDILVGISNLYDVGDHPTVPIQQMVRHTLIHYPPFPMLERRTGEKSQTFIFLFPSTDTCKLCGVSNPEISPEMFGYGARKCVGISIANSLIENIVCNITVQNLEFHPEIGNAYSGRSNDSVNTLESNLFLARTMCRVLWNGCAAVH